MGKRNPEKRNDGIRVMIRDRSTAASWVLVIVDTNSPMPTVHNTYIRDVAIKRR